MAPTTTHSKPGIMDRLRARPATHTTATPHGRTKVTHEESTNPITGTHTSTTKRKTNPKGHGHQGHGGGHALVAEKPTASHRQRRKPGIGDKLSGAMMQAKGEATGKPGLKVC